jgi:putative ABC transport system ATP-binding protein
MEARAVTKSFAYGGGDVHAVSDVTLGLRRGELGVLLGRSGSGKSTLLTLLAGWQQRDAGEIVPSGPAAWTWSELGYLPQRFGLVPELTVRENVELPARLRAAARAHRPDDELLRDLGLDELAAAAPPETSIGGSSAPPQPARSSSAPPC